MHKINRSSAVQNTIQNLMPRIVNGTLFKGISHLVKHGRFSRFGDGDDALTFSYEDVWPKMETDSVDIDPATNAKFDAAIQFQNSG